MKKKERMGGKYYTYIWSILIAALLCMILVAASSCSTTSKMRRIEKKTFRLKQSKEDRKIERQNKRKYKYCKPIKKINND